MKKKIFVILLAVLCTVFIQASVLAEENAAAYLKEYYGVSFDGDVSTADFNEALTAMGAEPLESDPLTLADAVVGAVRLAGMEELALVYDSADFPVNVADVLTDEGIYVDEDLAP